jgi:uncharacterized OsmC-like protein
MIGAEYLKLGGELLQLAFFAGTLYAVLKRMQKDVNGLGMRVREDRSAQEFRYLTIAVTTLATTKDHEERRWLAERFLDGWRRR